MGGVEELGGWWCPGRLLAGKLDSDALDSGVHHPMAAEQASGASTGGLSSRLDLAPTRRLDRRASVGGAGRKWIICQRGFLPGSPYRRLAGCCAQKIDAGVIPTRETSFEARPRTSPLPSVYRRFPVIFKIENGSLGASIRVYRKDDSE